MRLVRNTNPNGFSIVEILVATALVGGAVLSVFALLAPTLKALSISNNTLVASMLAQEGIELVTNIRDTNWYEDFNNGLDDNPSWNDQLDLNPGNQFDREAGIIDYDDNPFKITYIADNIIVKDSIGNLCNENDEDQMFGCLGTKLYQNSDKFYVHPDGGSTIGLTETPYRRIVMAQYNVGEDKLTVTSIVRWGAPDDNSKEARLTRYLYNWMQYN